MIYTFLTDNDLHASMKQDLLNQATENNPAFIEQAEQTAVGEMTSKLNQRYKISELFPTITKWDSNTSYSTGDYVYYNNTIYKALQDNTNSQPDNNPSDWEVNDPRDSRLITLAVDMTLYHLHARINPKKISELRSERYSKAIAWLDMVKDHMESPDFPLLDNSLDDIQYGSQTPRQHYW